MGFSARIPRLLPFGSVGWLHSGRVWLARARQVSFHLLLLGVYRCGGGGGTAKPRARFQFRRLLHATRWVCACGPRGADAHARGTSSALNVAPSSHPVCLAIQCFAPPAVPRIEQSASLMTESDASPTSFLRPLLYMHVRVV
jgi:hypothetical protein